MIKTIEDSAMFILKKKNFHKIPVEVKRNIVQIEDSSEDWYLVEVVGSKEDIEEFLLNGEVK